MKVAIVKYNAGNIYSVVNSLRRLGVEPLLTDNAEQISSADRVLFPGQGEARVAMTYLKEHNLDAVIKNLKQPVLGICIGQQLLCRHSEENDTDCLGIFDADVLKFRSERHEDKVPAMGWNDLYNFKSPLFRNIEKNDSYVYFVHGYYVPVCEYTIAEADYIQPYSAAINRGNFYATQFHPEKSGAVGAQIIKNFLEIDDK